MEETLRQLGGILLRAVPTFVLLLLLHFYLKLMFFKPLEKILRERYEATDGARKQAEASLARAAEKESAYEAALRAARAEIYQELEQARRKLQEERAERIRDARARAEAAVAKAKADLEAEAATLRKDLDAEAEALAERIARKILDGRAA